jgi:hypothetical protein
LGVNFITLNVFGPEFIYFCFPLVHNELEGTIKNFVAKRGFDILLAYYIQTFMIVTKSLEGTIKNFVAKRGFDILLAYYIQTFMIVTKSLFSFSYFYNLQEHAQIF